MDVAKDANVASTAKERIQSWEGGWLRGGVEGRERVGEGGVEGSSRCFYSEVGVVGRRERESAGESEKSETTMSVCEATASLR